MKSLLIIGAGGHGQAIAEIATSAEQWNNIAFADDKYPFDEKVMGFEVIGSWQDIEQIVKDFDEVFVAIGNNKVRKEKVTHLESLSVPIATIIHPLAIVSPSAKIGKGSAILAGAVVGTKAIVAKGSIINSNATADHDATLKQYAHLGVGVHIAGGVLVKEGAWMQAGSSAGYGVEVESWVTIGPNVGLSR